VLPTVASPALFLSNGRKTAAGSYFLFTFLFHIFLRENDPVHGGKASRPGEWHATCTTPSSAESQPCER
jgi:hypothetical protein